MTSLPPQIGAKGAERRYLTAVFADLVGYTQLSERLDPEDLRHIQKLYQELASEVMERYGGFVAQYLGDGVLVYFGYPTKSDNDAERAVKAGLEFVDRLVRLDLDMPSGEDPPVLAARVGINTGIVLIEAEAMRGVTTGHTATGEAINLAARLQAEAPPNGVVIGPETHALTHGRFEVETIGPKAIKGLAREIYFHRVIAPSALEDGGTSRKNRVSTFVGRQSELEDLITRWSQVTSDGQARVATILGEAGLGKSRLVSEFLRHVDRDNAHVLHAACHELFSTTPFNPVARLVRARIGITNQDDAAIRRRKIDDLMADFGGASAERAAMVLSLLGHDSPTNQPSPESFAYQSKRQLHDFVIALLRSMTETRPVVLWLENAQWIDPSSAELIQDLWHAMRDAPLLLVITKRQFPIGPALPGDAQSVELGRLSSDEGLAIAQGIPGAEALAHATIARALDAAEGIPLFIEHFISTLAEADGQNQARGARPSDIPFVLGDMLQARLDRRPGARRIVQVGACLGRSFSSRFLGEILELSPEALSEPLASLVSAEILTRTEFEAKPRYEFRHALLRRVAHESLTLAERRVLHARIADMLSAPHHGDAIPPELIAHHLTEAGRAAEAIGMWVEAARLSAKRSAHRESLEQSDRALSLLDKVKDTDQRQKLDVAIQTTRVAPILSGEGGASPRLDACCRHGLDLVGEALDPGVFPFAFGGFFYAFSTGDVERQAALADLFMARARGLELLPYQQLGHVLLGRAAFSQGHVDDMFLHYEAALAGYDAARDAQLAYQYGQNIEVTSHAWLAICHMLRGQGAPSAFHVGEALAKAKAFGHVDTLAVTLSFVTWVLEFADAWPSLAALGQTLGALSERHGLSTHRIVAGAIAGLLKIKGDQVAEGVKILDRVVKGIEATEFRFGASGYHVRLAEGRLKLGDAAGALAAAEKALATTRTSNFQCFEAEYRRLHVLASAAAQGQPVKDTAQALVEVADFAAQGGYRLFERRALLSLQELGAPLDAAIAARLAALDDLALMPKLLREALAKAGVGEA